MNSNLEVVKQLTEQEMFIASLETLIELYRAHPQMTIPYLADINVFARDKDELFAIAKKLGVKVRLGSDWAEVRVRIGAGNALVFNIRRADICERKQIGTRTVVRDKVKSEVIGTETVEEPVYKWVCPPDLGIEENQ